MAKQRPHQTPGTTRCECQKEDLRTLKRLSLDFDLGSNPDAFHEAVKALSEKLGARK